jgi:hypothetical protein
VFHTWLRWLQESTQKFRKAFQCQISLEHVQWFLNRYMQRTDRQIRKITYIFIFIAAKTERLVNDNVLREYFTISEWWQIYISCIHLKKEAWIIVEVLVPTYYKTQHHIAEDRNLYSEAQ